MTPFTLCLNCVSTSDFYDVKYYAVVDKFRVAHILNVPDRELFYFCV